jgi:hypothetical protein
VRHFGVGFEGFGDNGEGVALTVGIVSRFGERANEPGEMFKLSRCGAAALDAARAAGGKESAR